MQRRRARRALLAVVLVASFGSHPPMVAGATTAPSGRDPSFGTDGRYRLDLTAPSLDVANGAALGRNGVIGAGSAGGRFALGAFEIAGDPPFNGYYLEKLVDFGRPSAAHAVVSVGDTLIAAGHAGSDFAIAALQQNADPVRWFGDQGRVRTAFPGPAVAYGLVPMAGETTLAVGSAQAGAGSSIAMARYDRFGALDPTFGAGGKLVVDVTPGTDVAYAGALAYSVFPNQRILVAGRAGDGMLVTAFHLDGTPDTSFGSGGRVILDLTPGPDIARGLSTDLAGRVVVAGSAGTEGFLARFTASGALDPSFGGGGMVRSSFGGSAAGLRAVRGTGPVVVAGTVTGPGGDDGLVARFLESGAPDPSFGAGGRTVVDLGGAGDEVNALPDAESVHNWRLVGGDGADMVSVGITSDGSPAAGPGDYDRRAVDFGDATDEYGRAVTTLPDGKLLVAGDGTRGIILARLLPDGSPDATYGDGGVAITGVSARVAAITVAGDHVYLLAQLSSQYGAPAVLRFTAAGVLDRTYADHGFAFSGMSVDNGRASMALLPGGAVAVGWGRQLVTLNAAGDIVGRFNWGVRGNYVAAIAAQPDGKFVLLSRSTTGVGVTLDRFNPDATRDDTYFGATWLTSHPVRAEATALVRLADGRLVVGGWNTALPGSPPEVRDLVVAGFTAGGQPDAAFGTNGITRTPVADLGFVYGLAETADGRIVALHGPDPRSASEIVGLSRYLPNGTLDPSFGDNGLAAVSGVHPEGLGLLPAGPILVAGRTTGPTDLVVARALPADVSPPAGYHPVVPVRLLDTRVEGGGLGSDWTRTLQVAGRGGVPTSGATAVVLNVTATDSTAVSFLTVWPTGKPRPLASNLNLERGLTVPNLVTVKLGIGGQVSMYNYAGSTSVVVDLAGWYGTGGAGYTPVTPARILDTRTGLGAPAGAVGPGAAVSLSVAGRGGVPATGASAVVLNVTVTEPTAASFLTAWPAGAARPLASNLNYSAGRTVPNLVMVKLGDGGVVNLFNSAGSAHILADVAGWYGPEAGPGALFSTVVPNRILDTRAGAGAPVAKVGAGATLTLQVTGRGGVPADGVRAVLLNVTVTEPSAGSFLTVWPAGEAQPLASNLNYVAGQTVPNLVAVKVGSGGRVNLYNLAGAAHVIADVAGWYGA